MDNGHLIFNGRIFAETAQIERGYVYIREGRIASIGEDWSGIQASEMTDAKGLIVAPGLIDMHTHGIMDVDFMESSVEDTLRGLHEYARYGVCRVVASTLANPPETIIAQVKRLRDAMEDKKIGDMLHGVHIEGPWLAPRCRGGHALEYLRTPDPREVNRLLGEVGDVIRSVTFAPELPNSVWLTEQLSARGILPTIGHTEASFEEAQAVILAGARHGTHLYDTNLGYKENPNEALVMMPGHETALLLHDEVSVELIGCPVHVPKPFFRFINKVKPAAKKVIVTDSLVGTGMPEGTVLTYKDGRRVYVEEGVLRMIDDDPKVNGNLTGSAVTLNVALRRLREYCGITTDEALKWGTINPATTLGINRETGSLKVGKLADLLIMDDMFNAKRTLVKGRTVYDSRNNA
ncbi:MAG TPA: N-acetylglucosamine-6-phosphate deacetylase [Spirochaetia bacterium]|nr:N-acetylglucosamine-6-phosphate deacetylase [Spirochaetia bacterium]